MTSTPPPGEELYNRVLGGRYRIGRLLGRGGMGAVWVAKDEQDGSDVAIKLIKAALLDDPAALQRFRREMKVMAGLAHENIVRGVGSGEDQGVLWLAMELVSGQTLRERLDTRGRLPWQESLDVVRQIARGLGAAHDAGVVHRDLKPENIMIVPGDDGGVHVKLLDFGVAKASVAEGGQSSMTGTGFIVGTPGYVAPEVVLEGKTNDPRTDFYALGVVWYEMLTGQKPFSAKTAFALAMRHAHERPPTFNEVAPFTPVPAPVEGIVMRLMGKSPEERPPDAASLLVLVEGLRRGAAAAAAGTPLPDAFDATVTDVGEAPSGTAVVPIKVTPTPHPAGPPLATPATGMASPSPAWRRAPSDLHLFRQLPTRLKVLLIAGAVALSLATLGVIAVAVLGGRQPGGDDPAVRAPGSAAGGERLVAVAAAMEHAEVDTGVATPPVPSTLATLAEGGSTAQDTIAPIARSGEATDAGLAHADRRMTANRKVEQPVSPPPSPPHPTNEPVPPTASVSYGQWSLSAPGYKVKVVVDGVTYKEPPIIGELLPVGEHELVLIDLDTKAVLLARRITISTTEPLRLVFGQEAQ